MSILSLADAKTFLGISGSAQDAELQDTLDAAHESVAYLCGPTEPETVTETLEGSGAIALHRTPVLSVTSVSGEVYGTYNPANLRLNKDSGVIRAKAYTTPLGTDYYTVVYQAGRDSVPPAIVQGIKIILKHQWRTRRGSSVRPGTQQKAEDVSEVQVLGYAIPNSALQVLDRYLRGPAVG